MEKSGWEEGKATSFSSIFEFPGLLAFDLKPKDLYVASVVH